MLRRPTLASFAVAATLLSLCGAALAQSGMIRFSGMIVEPPCNFSLAAAPADRLQLRSACPRPASGNVAFVDNDNQKVLRTVRFTEASQPIGVPANQHDRGQRLIAVVTYQ
ncbi:type 1 fimbrial protein [Burkholderia sp. FERM BP-3421]|jgi:type 1 fimbria pilin|uniref:type 1 fimbrial protein n=1 Tax=Burkholderia sp. FERM BP-3421 TaxID=1494466 RepID=UPI00235DED32|nr:type 1 fimbrial protein [Burkholderia sp. FERM BP-3421]WDD92037.1 type 1 fimbrial protein [Burkholderia sp. FERM BP-3421]